MKHDQMKEQLLMAAQRYAKGDATALDLFSRMCNEGEEAKRILRAKGYGVTGMNVVDTAALVADVGVSNG